MSYFLGNSPRYRVAFGGSISVKSEKLLPYSALKYGVLTLFCGPHTRSKAKRSLKRLGGSKPPAARKPWAERVSEMLRYVFISLPGTKKIMTEPRPNIPEIREEYLSISAAALYAVCLALYTIAKDHGGIMDVPDEVWKRAADKWSTHLDWGKRADSSFVGTILVPIVDKKTNKPTGKYTIAPGRDAVEGAARLLLQRAEAKPVAA